jgi:hypothetical protein
MVALSALQVHTKPGKSHESFVCVLRVHEKTTKQVTQNKRATINTFFIIMVQKLIVTNIIVK